MYQSNKQRRLSLTSKLTISFVCLGMLPVGVLAVITFLASSKITEEVGLTYQRLASNTIESIERNLFERYGDVQAFGANHAIKNRDSWYQRGSKVNAIAEAANTYVSLYGIYPLSIIVDTEGKVIATNDRDAHGKSLDTDWIYDENFKDASWFKAAMSGKFLKSDLLDGTHVEDVESNAMVSRVVGGEGLVIGYTAPIKDADGRVIAIWKNFADFALVEEIIASAFNKLADAGVKTTELTLLDRQGRVIVDFDPSSHNGSLDVVHDMSVFKKFNLAENGVAPAQDVIKGNSGWGLSRHSRKQIDQVAGYAPSEGALGYPGLGWSMLVRVDEHEALAIEKAIRFKVIAVVSIGAALLAIASILLGRFISKPMLAAAESLESIGSSVASSASEVATASQVLAEGASEQAASLEETSASMEELASMTRKNADNASAAQAAAKGAKRAVETGTGQMATMSSTMDGIRSASQDITKILKSIDEIAFQTNILALNAAVEAARAGEAGAGFAVVADEVRALAQRCASASSETATMIEESVRKSEEGVEISTVVSNSLKDIHEQVTELDQLVTDIAMASGEQSEGISQINTAITDMDRVTQGNAASAEESSSAATELDGQGKSLQETVARLKALVTGMSEMTGKSPATKSLQRHHSSKAPQQHPRATAVPARQSPNKEFDDFADF